jgi:alpha-N-acetylglucosaminidase
VVTYSYTMAWYDWAKWEYLLDWASLHGVNMPLAIGGQE